MGENGCHLGILELLLDLNADIDFQNSDRGGVTPSGANDVSTVATLGHLDIVECLVKRGANKEDAISSAACGYHPLPSTQHLVKRGMRVNTVAEEGASLLMLVVGSQFTHDADRALYATQWLVLNEADINIRDKTGCTVLDLCGTTRCTVSSSVS